MHPPCWGRADGSLRAKSAGPRLLVELACLVTFQVLLYWGFTRQVDLHVWDEYHYIRQGRLLGTGQWARVDYAWSLPLAGIHALCGWLGLAPIRQHDLVTMGCALAATLGLWWALRPLLSPTAAFLAAAWGAVGYATLFLEYAVANSYALGLLLVCVALGWVARGRPYLALVALVVASLNRTEVSLWILAVGVLWLLVRDRDGQRGGRSVGWAYAGVGALLLVLLNHSWRAQNRRWMAFEQHYDWGHPHSAPAAELFAGAKTPLDALRANPEAFGEHVLGNLVALPEGVGRLIWGTEGSMPWLRGILVAGLGVLAAIGLWRAVARREWLPAGIGRPTWLFLAGSLTVSVVGLLLLPRTLLLLPLLPLVLLLVFGWATEGWGRIVRIAPRLKALPALAPVLVVLMVSFPSGPFRRAVDAPPPHRAAVPLLGEHARADETLLAAQAEALLFFAEVNVKASINPSAIDFESLQGTLAFGDILDRFDPDLILLTPLLRRSVVSRLPLDDLLERQGWGVVEQSGAVALLRHAPRDKKAVDIARMPTTAHNDD